VALRLWLPSASALVVIDHVPLLPTVPPPTAVGPSRNVTVSPTSPAPVITGVELVAADADASPDGAGADVLRVKLSEAVVVLPDRSVSLATSVCAPSDRPIGLKIQAPSGSAVAMSATGLPSTVKSTVALPSPD